MNSVDPLNSSLYFSAAAQAAQAKKKESETNKTGAKRRIFSDFLKDAISDDSQSISEMIAPEIANLDYAKAVETLLDAVYSSGSDLRKNQTPEGVQKYRRAVKNFIGYVVTKCYDVEHTKGIQTAAKSKLGGKRQKVFCSIKVIDEKLDKLAGEVLINQRNQIEFLAKIDEINGLLVDLLT